MTIIKKQIEVFVVDDKEFSTLSEAQAYLQSLKIDITSREELESILLLN